MCLWDFRQKFSDEDIKGSAQWELALDWLLLDQRLDGLDISALEAGYLGAQVSILSVNACYQQGSEVQWQRNGCKKHAIPCRDAWRVSKSR